MSKYVYKIRHFKFRRITVVADNKGDALLKAMNEVDRKCYAVRIVPPVMADYQLRSIDGKCAGCDKPVNDVKRGTCAVLLLCPIHWI